MKQLVKVGSTSYRSVIFVQNSTSTTGGGLTGLTSAASGLTWYWYTNTNGTSSAVSIVGETLGTWTSGGFIQIDATNLPGFYEIGVPNALLASGVNWAVMELFGAANMVPVTVEFQITGFDPTSGTMTATVPTLSTNVNVQQWLGTAVTSNAGTPIVFPSGGTITTVTGTVAAVTTCTGVGTATLVLGGTIGTATVASGTITTVSGNVVGSVGSVVGTVTATVPTEVSANVTQWLGTAVTSSAGVPITTNLGTITATVPTLSTNVNVQQWLGTAVTSNAGIPIVFPSGGTITTVTGTVAAVTTATSVGSVVGTVTATVPTEVSANVTQWLGTAVTSSAGVPITTNNGTVTATVPTLSTNVNVTQWLGTAVTSNAGVPLVDVNGITGTVTATVVGGTIATVTNPVSISTGQLTVIRNTALSGFTFPMYDATSGNPATGLSVSCSISIDGASLVASTHSPSEVGSGIYKLNLAAADLDGTVITLVFVASAASATIVTLITQA